MNVCRTLLELNEINTLPDTAIHLFIAHLSEEFL